MKIGILYPKSNTHPGMMMDYMDGLKAALKVQQLPEHILLISESIGFGGNDKEVYEKAEKLLVLEGVDVLVAYVDLRVLELLKPLLLASGKMVLAVNPGANYPQNWQPEANIVHLTLQHAFLCALTGKLASQVNKTKAAMCTTFYDCGYLHTASMVDQFAAAGGSISYNYVNNQRNDETFDITPLTGYLSSDPETDSLLCIFDSLPSSLFYAHLNNYNGAERLQLFVSPMMLEQKALENISGGFNFSVDGYMPWHAAVQNKANVFFLESYSQLTKRTGTCFSLLGWETGLIIQELFLRGAGEYGDGKQLAEALAAIKISSPRGELKLDPATNYFTAPVCKCSVKQQAQNCLVAWMEVPEKEWRDFVQAPVHGVSSGWTNTYLCY